MKNVVQSRLGFTLIELLVVVLIIGILAAVALPQYQQAVEKSRAAEALTNIGSFKKAVEVWQLANPGEGGTFSGNYPRMGELDIDIPADWVQATSAMIHENAYPDSKSCSKNFCYDITANWVKAYRANSSTYKYGIWYDFSYHTYACYAFTAADLKLCNSLSNIDSVYPTL